MRIVFLGDSLTEGVTGASYLRILGQRIASDPRLRDVELVNAGQGGDTILHLARRVASDVAPYVPDWVVVFVGVNDFRTWYVRRSFPTRANLGSGYYFLRRKHLWHAVTPRRYSDGLWALVDDLRARTQARIALCTPATASESRDTRAERMLDAYAGRVREVARERDCALIDVRAAFLAAEASLEASGADGYHLTCDGVHLSDAGAALVAGVFYDWLLRAALVDRTS
ncbi:MAG TPA: GDSL-type esterase/lipase family protein [Ktedonobacterales bacterium]|nr:GDSL-type esterase/lipase family protein [Ktedonobacterales bacterium]